MFSDDKLKLNISKIRSNAFTSPIKTVWGIEMVLFDQMMPSLATTVGSVHAA